MTNITHIVVTRAGKIVLVTTPDNEAYAFSLVRSRIYSWDDINGVRVISAA